MLDTGRYLALYPYLKHRNRSNRQWRAMAVKSILARLEIGVF